MKSTVKLVLFDLDGTLVDTASGLASALADLCRSLGQPSPTLREVRPWCSAGARGLLQLALNVRPSDENFARYRTEFLQHYEKHLLSGSVAFAHSDQLLQEILAMGLRVGIVTNKPTALTLPLLHHLNWWSRLSCVTCGDSTPRPKPAPDPLWLACRVSGFAPAEALYIGDDVRDIDAGRAAGMKTAIAGWGYLGPDPKPLHEWAADSILLQMLDWKIAIA